jgi:hypothetical protein
LVEAARAAYDQIATVEQQALVTNYAALVSAEQRIAALAPTEDVIEDTVTEQGGGMAVAVMITVVVAFIGFIVYRNRKENEA